MDKSSSVKMTVIVPCQRCGKNIYKEIDSAYKSSSIREILVKSTELSSEMVFGKQRLICEACKKEYEDLIIVRNDAADKFLGEV